ncbi:hypothetical protein AMYX_20940 [Anaeromyxobacter diazotrophicus]|uniref:Uncharacterized protein n=1 Tax=Anaeromyxobacter diazotrophicus TaxID=2590199 RepID=A0A7I9VLR3_9BACT|nr:hypothetical protein AMYX_20940 [Anaeromyxobacter diazotrophicus]
MTAAATSGAVAVAVAVPVEVEVELAVEVAVEVDVAVEVEDPICLAPRTVERGRASAFAGAKPESGPVLLARAPARFSWAGGGRL